MGATQHEASSLTDTTGAAGFVTDPVAMDRTALEAVYKALAGEGWRNNTNWLSQAPMASWHGVETDDEGRVVKLDLNFNELSGEIPPEIGRLTELRYLALSASGGRVRGKVPGELGRLAKLEYLNFDSGKLTELPRGVFSRMSRLRFLSLRGNFLRDLPAGLFVGLRSLEYVNFDLNHGSPFQLPVSARRTDSTGIVAHMSSGAPVPLVAFLASTGADMSSSTISLSPGNQTSNQTVTAIAHERPAYVSVTAASAVPRNCGSTEPCFQGFEIVPGDGAVLANPETVSLSLAAVHLTQSVQDMSGSVPIIAGRPALLRVFATSDQPNTFGLSAEAGILVDGREVDRAILDRVRGVPMRPSQGHLDLSYDVELPAEFVRPGMEAIVHLNTDNAIPAGTVSQRFSFDIVQVPVFQVTIVPVLLADETGNAAAEAMAGLTADSHHFDDAKAYLPMDEMAVRVREPLRSEYNSSDLVTRPGWTKVLLEIYELWKAEGRDGYYYGVVRHPTVVTAPAAPAGVAFLSDPPTPVALGIGLGYLFAHEVGHNMGLKHVGCNSASDDHSYPHEKALIGEWGYDEARGEMKDPRKHKDFMGCGNYPFWVSDYHFKKALDHRLNREGKSHGTGGTTANDGERTVIVEGRVVGSGESGAREG